jgi:hypothetical protein
MAINQRTKRQLACKVVNLHAMSPKEHAGDNKQDKRDIEASQKWCNRWAREVEILQSLTHVRCFDVPEAMTLTVLKATYHRSRNGIQE